MHEILAGVGMARDFDIPVEVTDRARIRELWPSAVVDDLVGGVLFPSDATVNPGDAALAFAKGAVDGRRALRAGHRGDRVPFRPADRRRVVGLDTSRGPIEAETVVLAAGPVDERAGTPGRRQRRALPGRARLGHDRGGAGRGPGCAVPARPRRLDLHPPVPRSVRHRGVRAERQADRAVGRARRPGSPSSGRTGTTSRRRWRRPGSGCRSSSRSASPTSSAAPESFTPDSNFQLGFVPEFDGLFVAAGLNSQGIIFAPGRRPGGGGVDRRGPSDDGSRRGRVARMERWMNQPAWLHERTEESLGGLYELHWPGKQPRTGRDVRRVPLYEPFRRPGPRSGRRRAGSARTGSSPGSWIRRSATTSRRRRGSRRSARRSAATREGVALYDLSTYAKFVVQGAEALDGPATARDVRPGRGAGPDRLHAALQRARRHRDGPDDHAPRRGPVPRPRPDADPAPDRRPAAARVAGGGGGHGRDVGLGDAPPGRTALAGAARSPDGCRRRRATAWPFLQAREIDVGRARAWAFRVSFTGELGWELSVPTEFVGGPVRAGRSRRRGPRAAPRRRLRVRCRARWSAASARGATTSGPLNDPFAAGLGFAVSRRKAIDFVGRDSARTVARRRARAASRQRPRPRRRAVARRIAASRRRAGRATSRAPRSRRPWAARPASAGSAARSTASWQVEIGGDAGPVPGQPRAVLRPARGPTPELTVSCGRDPSSRSGRRRPHPRPASGGRPCARSGRRRRSGCGRAGPRARRAGRCR